MSSACPVILIKLRQLFHLANLPEMRLMMTWNARAALDDAHDDEHDLTWSPPLSNCQSRIMVRPRQTSKLNVLRVLTSLGRKNSIGSLDRVNSDEFIYTRESVLFGPVCLPDTIEMLKK